MHLYYIGICNLKVRFAKLYFLLNRFAQSGKLCYIFDSAYHSLKENGVIIYSTCTFTREENTNNIKYFTEKYPDLYIETVNFPDNIFISKDEYGGNYIDYRNKYLDGFYIAKFRKKGKDEI